MRGREEKRETEPVTATWTRRRVLASASVGTATVLAGCSTIGESATPTPVAEATVTVRISNRDGVERPYEVVVRQGSSVTNEFSGVLPADPEQSVEMVATFRASAEQHQVTVSTDAGQVGRTWEPSECPDFVVDVSVENGRPAFETECRGAST
ncbi:hypothetical protein [Salinigranum salinum]|uniref:hypothetical protein n=1 Tax=Salinigranum salinum TaxID=1364937 RepID=UPI001260C928|nr:hypothetical protein [Salinigranum salinum]